MVRIIDSLSSYEPVEGHVPQHKVATGTQWAPKSDVQCQRRMRLAALEKGFERLGDEIRTVVESFQRSGIQP